MFDKILLYFANRLKEPTTWVGIVVAIAGALNLAVDQTQANAIAAGIAAIVAIVLGAIKAKNAPDRKRGAADPSIPAVDVRDDSAADGVQPVDLTRERHGDARDQWRHRNGP